MWVVRTVLRGIGAAIHGGDARPRRRPMVGKRSRGPCRLFLPAAHQIASFEVLESRRLLVNLVVYGTPDRDTISFDEFFEEGYWFVFPKGDKSNCVRVDQLDSIEPTFR